MYGFVIAIMLCSGTNCDLVQAEPDITYPSYDACNKARVQNAAALKALADKRATPRRPAQILCLHPIETIVEVEEPHDVLDTAIVHKEPSAASLYVGLVEKGKRTLVTGLVAGTDWVRVLLPDGKSGFVYADRLHKVGEPTRTTSVTAGNPAAGKLEATAPSAPSPAAPAPPPQPATIATTAPPAAWAPTAQGPAPQALALPPPAPPPPPMAAAEPAGQAELRDCEHCPVMVALPGGSFEMGSNEDYSERPPHRVTLQPFALAKFEVSVAEWNVCVAAQTCSYKPPVEPSPERRPVANLSWNDASGYVRWLQEVTGKPYRLPTEAEWEYAAAAGTTTRFGWGDQPGAGMADCKGCGGPHNDRSPADSGSLKPNAWGLYDMEGGVAEWVEDCWHASYQGAPTDGAAWLKQYCPRHVLRGGSWLNPPSDITVRVRNFYDTGVRYVGNGMRVALGLH